MRKFLYIAAAVLMLSGCQKEELAPKPIETTTAEIIETTEAETTVAATEESVEATEEEVATPELQYVDGVLVIPSEFPTFEDGKPHTLYFYADENGMTKDTFINISVPEHDIASVSFPIRFIEDSKDELIPANDDGTWTLNTDEDRYKVYDYSTMPDYLPEGSWSRYVPAYGIIGIIDCEATISGDIPTEDEMKNVGSKYGLISGGPIFEDLSKDGSRVFTSYCATPAPYNPKFEDSYNYYGAFSIRFTKEGQAQGTFYCHVDDLKISQKYASYTVQSLRFAD